MMLLDVLKQRLTRLNVDEVLTSKAIQEVTQERSLGELLTIAEVDNLLRFIIANNKLTQSLVLVEALLIVLIQNKRLRYADLEPFFGLFFKQGHLESVITLHEVFLSKNSASPNTLFNFAYYLDKHGHYQDAISSYKKALSLGISSPEEVYLNIAKIYAESLNEPGQAKVYLTKALDLKPSYVAGLLNLANLDAACGRKNESLQSYENVLKHEPNNALALSRILDLNNSEEIANRAISALDVIKDQQARLDLQFSLARYYDKQGEYLKAADFLALANQALKQSYPKYDQSKQQQLVTNLLKLAEEFKASKLETNLERKTQPLFICGMFRSGSTLLEKVLSKHSSISSAGEMPFFPNRFGNSVFNFVESARSISNQQLEEILDAHQVLLQKVSGQASDVYTIDKRPDNVFYIPLIKKLYPEAKIIITKRDIRDISVSILFQQLGPSFTYANDASDINHYHLQMMRLIEGYKSIYGSDLYFVRYEDVVSEFEDTISQCLRFLGLEFESECTQFYKTNETSFTASMEQIRSPLYNQSVGRWKNYKPLLSL